MYHIKLHTGYRYPRGCWRGMEKQIWIKVEHHFIVEATQEKQLWQAAGKTDELWKK